MTIDERMLDELDMERELYKVNHECWVVKQDGAIEIGQVE
jgi:hypothetical protein